MFSSLFLVVLQTVTFALPALAQTVVDPPEPDLEATIRDAIDKPAGSISDADCDSAPTLYASFSNITKLPGLQYRTQLTSLDLRYNDTSDTHPLQGKTGSRISCHPTGARP